jgi:hypothetical protein
MVSKIIAKWNIGKRCRGAYAKNKTWFRIF